MTSVLIEVTMQPLRDSCREIIFKSNYSLKGGYIRL